MSPNTIFRLFLLSKTALFHVVGPGETLPHICTVYGLDLTKVARINKLLPPYTLKDGETVFLPAQALLAEGQNTGSSKGSRAVTLTADTAKKPWPMPSSERRTRSFRTGVSRTRRVLTSPFGYRWEGCTRDST